jgi:hypothetical protein
MANIQFEINALLTGLTLAEQENIKNLIEKTIVDKITKDVCYICQDTIKLPVKLKKEVFCEDCGVESYACLDCTRKWLQLNVQRSERKVVKHLICNKQINTTHLDAFRSYEIDEKYIDLLDKHKPLIMVCNCKKEGTRREIRDHVKNLECIESYRKCPNHNCTFIDKLPKYILHIEDCLRR